MSETTAARGAPRGLGVPGWTVAVVDWVERGLIAVLYGWLVVRIGAGFATEGSLVDLILLPSEGLVVGFILIRRTTSEVSRRPADWGLAFSATVAPLFARPALGFGLVPPLAAAILMLTGILVQVHAKLVLGRSFGCVPANRGLKLGGPYRYVRHPMYMGYLLTHCGFLLMNPSAWNLGVYGLAYALQIPRLLAEERLLRRDFRYLTYMARVPYRLIPGVF